jgi:hypothetical protein
VGLKRWLGIRGQEDFAKTATDIYGQRVGGLKVDRGEDYSLVRYERSDGFDYEAYKSIQIAANKGKIDRVSVSRENVAFLCRHLQSSGVTVNSVLCHGTRNAAEQGFFKTVLPHAEILGTEISDAADQYPMTIRWDFHEVKPEWIGRYDLVFSNSWDHSYNPQKLFRAWLSCVAPGGALVVEWAEFNTPDRGVHKWFAFFAPLRALMPTTVTDPFRATLEGLIRVLREQSAGGEFVEPTVLEGLPDRQSGQRLVIVRRKS